MLVLLPGLDGTGLLFSPLLEQLEPMIATQIVSYPARDDLSYIDLIELVCKQLPSSTPIVLLGESFSGPIAVAIAANAPTNLRGVILCASFVSNPHSRMRMFKRILRYLPFKKIPIGVIEKFGFGNYSNRDLCALLTLALSELSHETMVARLQEIIEIDVSRDLEEIKLPLLYIQAKQDRLVPSSALKRIKKIQPEIEVAQIEGPHFLLQTRPELVTEKLIAFFNDLKTKSATDSFTSEYFPKPIVDLGR